MNATTFRRWLAVIAVVLGAVVSISIIFGNFIIPVISAALTIGLIYVLRRRTKDVTQDERTTLLYDKAAGATIKFCVPVAAFAGLVLFALREHLSAELVSACYVLTYSACILLLVHQAFYSYYDRKH
jgi:uncharacterized membrane protein